MPSSFRVGVAHNEVTGDDRVVIGLGDEHQDESELIFFTEENAIFLRDQLDEHIKKLRESRLAREAGLAKGRS